MIVIFTTESSGDSLKKTRSILDMYASRIGSRTWKTHITMEGLHTIKYLLAMAATRSMSVSCHRVVSGQMALEWIVGSRKKFNERGMMCISGESMKEHLDTHPSIGFLSRMAALLHDIGKSTMGFQNGTLRNSGPVDEFRHEYISMLIFAYLIEGKTDREWMADAASGEWSNINYTTLNQTLFGKTRYEFNAIPPVASLILWIIGSHHMLPGTKRHGHYNPIGGGSFAGSFNEIINSISSIHYFRGKSGTGMIKKLNDTSFYGNPMTDVWNFEMRNVLGSYDLNEMESFISTSMVNGSWGYTLRLARLSMMMGDYRFSKMGQGECHPKGNGMYANTRQKPGNRTEGKVLNQLLDDHLVGVSRYTRTFAQQLDTLTHQCDRVYDIHKVAERSSGKYAWQDMISDAIKSNDLTEGCLVINVASTGTGKTIGNAKIMHALSGDDSMRYTMALGLRSLTRQTGHVYRDQLGLSEYESGLLIGGKTEYLDSEIQTLDSLTFGKQSFNPEQSSGGRINGALKNAYGDVLSDAALMMISTPVLCCTIDHMMPAINAIGGSGIGSILRMLSSDIVIDEVDDYEFRDLMCIGRLVHLAGVCGRNITISSATITPGIAKSFQRAYMAGWESYALTNKRKPRCSCVICDEFEVKVLKNVKVNAFDKAYDIFSRRRARLVDRLPVTRLADIVHINQHTRESYYAGLISGIKTKHGANYHMCKGKKVSIGLVFVRRVADCVKVTQALDRSGRWGDCEIRLMPYHAVQTQQLRSKKEAYLDSVLSHASTSCRDTVIYKHIEACKKPNIIFILIATSVETTGRDHEFDWGILDPSSCRSIVQAGGRVNRHSNRPVSEPNIGIMLYNLLDIDNADAHKVAFCNPGYESESLHLESHRLADLLPLQQKKLIINSNLRTLHSNDSQSLAGIEHININRLQDEKVGFKTLIGYCQLFWTTGGPTEEFKFRGSQKTLEMKMEIINGEFILKGRDNKRDGWFNKNTIVYRPDIEIVNEWHSFTYEGPMDIQLDEYKTKLASGYVYSTAFGVCPEKSLAQ